SPAISAPAPCRRSGCAARPTPAFPSSDRARIADRALAPAGRKLHIAVPVSFVPLRVRSHGSLLWGTASPEALIERAFELGHSALALTDRDNLYLAIRFLQSARAQGLRPLIGAELTHGPHTLLLLASDRRGYAHLCRILSLRHLEPTFDPVRAL